MVLFWGYHEGHVGCLCTKCQPSVDGAVIDGVSHTHWATIYPSQPSAYAPSPAWWAPTHPSGPTVNGPSVKHFLAGHTISSLGPHLTVEHASQ